MGSACEVDASTDELESFFADDIMYGFFHPSADFVVQALACIVTVFRSVAERHSFFLHMGPGKTEAMVALRGAGAKVLQKTVVQSRRNTSGPALREGCDLL